MQLEFELVEDDFWAFNHVAASGRGPKSYVLTSLGYLTWIAIGYLGMHLYRTGEALGFSTLQWIQGPGVIAVLLFLVGYLPTRYNRRVFRPLPGRFILGRRTYVFTEDSIEFTSAHSHSRYDWSSVVDFVDSKDHFFLFIDSTAAFIIPKRIFDSPDTMNSFGRLVSGMLSEHGGDNT